MRRTTSLFLGFVAAGLALAPLVSAYSTGITGVARPAQGCTCHGMAGTTSNKTTEVSVVGLPDAYVPSTTYHLQAWVRGIALPAPRFAGFDLEATAGTLHALDSSAWVSGLDGQATHSAPKSVGFGSPTYRRSATSTSIPCASANSACSGGPASPTAAWAAASMRRVG